MAKRRKAWIGVGVIVLLLVAIPFVRPVDEPKYNGRYLSEWLDQYVRVFYQQSSAECVAAQEAVRSIGTNALPYYLDWIACEPARWRMALRRNVPAWMNNPALDNILIGTSDRRASYAITGIGILGTNALSVVPALESLLKDSSKARGSVRAMYALASIGESALPILKSALASTNQLNRHSIPGALRFAACQVGTNVCLPILVEATQDRASLVRQAATNVLKEIAPELLTNAASQ